jgi:hypothetical protein
VQRRAPEAGRERGTEEYSYERTATGWSEVLAGMTAGKAAAQNGRYGQRRVSPEPLGKFEERVEVVWSVEKKRWST